MSRHRLLQTMYESDANGHTSSHEHEFRTRTRLLCEAFRAMEDMKLMLIGPCSSGLEVIDCRGAEVLFALLVEDLETLGVEVVLIDSARANYRNSAAAWLSVTWRVLTQFASVSHVSFHSSRSYAYLLPLVLLWNTLRKRRVSLRVFGGDFRDRMEGVASLDRFIVRWIGGRVSDLFLETRRNVEVALDRGYTAHWFPNVRRPVDSAQPPSGFNKRFAFFGQIRIDKGIELLLAASDQLDDSYTIDVYGPLVDDFAWSEHRACYKGVLSPCDVGAMMGQYDVIVLPTWYRDEGYPGVVIEAFAAARPVIATRWRDIPELIEDGVTGRLVPPRDLRSLVDAILSFDVSNHSTFAAAAAARFTETHRSLVQTRVFLETISRSCRPEFVC